MIKSPILFNTWKHHLGYIKSRLAEYSPGNITSFQEIIKELLSIGESLMDLYTGALSPKDISEEIFVYLNKEEVLELRKYERWLKAGGNNYRTVKISDNSTWILLMGDIEDRFIHIHPARYSHNSIRVKANTLKTAIAVIAWMKINSSKAGIEQINIIRKKHLSLSPIKSLSSCSGLEALLALLNI